MILILGGAYQGKLEYAKETLGIQPKQIFFCSDSRIDFTKECICGIEEFTYACVRQELDPVAYFRENAAQWQDSVLICRDIFCGVVPMDAMQRKWRQATGRLCQYLASEATQVSRIFCGLEQRLK